MLCIVDSTSALREPQYSFRHIAVPGLDEPARVLVPEVGDALPHLDREANARVAGSGRDSLAGVEDSVNLEPPPVLPEHSERADPALGRSVGDDGDVALAWSSFLSRSRHPAHVAPSKYKNECSYYHTEDAVALIAF